MTEQEKREKVIKGLETCLNRSGICSNRECTYFDCDNCITQLLTDALALLKAQEPIAPVRVNRYMETDENGKWYSPETYDCGNCGVELCGKAYYCHLCGKAVRWE